MTPLTNSRLEERDQVDRLLGDTLFSHSKRYGAFLRFVAERALTNNQEPLSERTIGVEVFARNPNYDTDADPIVRVTASELRKRLAQYYDDPAHGNEIRILLRKGSYVAEFVAPTVDPPRIDPPPLPPPAELLATPARLRPRWYYAALLAACALLAIVFWAARPKPSLSDLFWGPLIEGPHDVVLSFSQISDHVRFESSDPPHLAWMDALTPEPSPLDVPLSTYSHALVHVSALSTTARMSEFLGAKGKHAVLKGEHDLTMGALRQAPAIILGGLNNQWTSRIAPQARLSFGGEGTLRYIRDSQNPISREWSFDAKVRSDDRAKDYIIVSRLTDTSSGRVTVLAGGFSDWGTEAAVDLLTDPVQMQKVLGASAAKWSARNVQIALECSVVNRESGMPRFLGAYTW